MISQHASIKPYSYCLMPFLFILSSICPVSMIFSKLFHYVVAVEIPSISSGRYIKVSLLFLFCLKLCRGKIFSPEYPSSVEANWSIVFLYCLQFDMWVSNFASFSLYVADKFELSLPNFKYKCHFCFLFSLNLRCCSDIRSMLFSSSYSRTKFLFPQVYS